MKTPIPSSSLKLLAGLLCLAGSASNTLAAQDGSSVQNLTKRPSVSDYLGVNYFTFFDGPGLGTDFSKSPNALGRPSDRGWSLWTNPP